MDRRLRRSPEDFECFPMLQGVISFWYAKLVGPDWNDKVAVDIVK